MFLFYYIGHRPWFMNLCLGKTLPAGAGETQLATGNGAADTAFRLGAEGFGGAELVKVNDRVTAVADEVNMGIRVGIEPFNALYRRDTDSQPLLLKQLQVPVHGAYGQIRDLRLQISVDGFSRGMCVSLPQVGKDGVALFEVFRSGFHVSPPKRE